MIWILIAKSSGWLVCDAERFIGWVALLFGLLGKLLVGSGARLVVSALVWEPLYLGLARIAVISRSWVRCKCGFMNLGSGVEYWVGLWVRSRVGYRECFVQNFHFCGLRIGVSICRGHRSKGSRVMDGFSFG